MFVPRIRLSSSTRVARMLGFTGFVLAAIGMTPLTLDAQIAGGGNDSSAVMLPNGDVWTAGRNASNTMGVTTLVGSGRVRHLAFTGATSMAHGVSHVVALTSTGDVYVWGSNSFGLFGSSSPSTSATPMLSAFPAGATAIAAGGWSTYAVVGGQVYAAGFNSSGQLGDGTMTNRSTPTLIPSFNNVVAIAAGQAHVLARKNDGTLWAWGRGTSGQLGDGAGTTSTSPVQVSGLAGVGSIAAGDNHSLALVGTTLYAWGWNSSGQIGNGTWANQNTPVSVGGSYGAIAAGLYSSTAVTVLGDVYAWGVAAAMPVGNPAIQNSPVLVPGPSNIYAVGQGLSSRFAFGTDGSIWAWGQNDWGRLGDGIYNEFRKIPLDVAAAGTVWRTPNPDLSKWGGVAGNVIVTNVLPASTTMTYTLNGVDPTVFDTVIPSGNTIVTSTGQTLKVKAFSSIGMPDSGVSKAVF
jgi:alpha-tubulin suppressor-like RCC1 family protein